MNRPGRTFAAYHHQRAEWYRLMALIEDTKAHLRTEASVTHRRSLRASLDHFKADLIRLEARMKIRNAHLVVGLPPDTPPEGGAPAGNVTNIFSRKRVG